MQTVVQDEARLIAMMRRLPYFRGLGEVSLARLARGSGQVAVNRGEILYMKGGNVAYVGVVIAGQFRVQLPLADGGERVLVFARQGYSFGEETVLHDIPSPVSVVAMQNGHLLAVERSVFSTELRGNPIFAQTVLMQVSQRLVEHFGGLEMCNLRHSLDRVTCYLRNQVSQGNGACLEFDLPARKGQIAAKLGMTPETFSRALRGLEREGVVQVRGARVRIVDQSRLEFGRRDVPMH